MSNPIDLWEDVVDIAETSVVDFQSRTRPENVYDAESVYRSVTNQMAEQSDVSASLVMDYAVRVYVAWLCDHRNDIMDVRTESKQNRLLPPRGWIDDNIDRLPTYDVSIERETIENPSDRQIGFQTTDEIHDIVSKLVENYDEWQNYDALFKEAITFVVDGYTTKDTLLHERMLNEQ